MAFGTGPNARASSKSIGREVIEERIGLALVKYIQIKFPGLSRGLWAPTVPGHDVKLLLGRGGTKDSREERILCISGAGKSRHRNSVPGVGKEKGFDRKVSQMCMHDKKILNVKSKEGREMIAKEKNC